MFEQFSCNKHPKLMKNNLNKKKQAFCFSVFFSPLFLFLLFLSFLRRILPLALFFFFPPSFTTILLSQNFPSLFTHRIYFRINLSLSPFPPFFPFLLSLSFPPFLSLFSPTAAAGWAWLCSADRRRKRTVLDPTRDEERSIFSSERRKGGGNVSIFFGF